MVLPLNIKNILERIHKSEDEWKALYMGVWSGVYYLEDMKKNKPELWEKKLDFGLPGSKNKKHPYIPRDLHEILKTRDKWITLTHLQVLFSLFEDMCREASGVLFNIYPNTYKWNEMKSFLQNIGLSQVKIAELHLSKETRNCYVHNSSKIDREWLDAYFQARGIKKTSLNNRDIKDGLDQDLLHQVEDWHSLIINSTKEIEQVIVSKK